MFLYRSKENKNCSRQCHKMSHLDLEHLFNVSTYTQTLMNFHEASPVPTNSSNKRLKIRLNEDTMSSKRNSTLEVSIPNLPPHDKFVTFIEIDGPTSAETVAVDEHVHT